MIPSTLLSICTVLKAQNGALYLSINILQDWLFFQRLDDRKCIWRLYKNRRWVTDDCEFDYIISLKTYLPVLLTPELVVLLYYNLKHFSDLWKKTGMHKFRINDNFKTYLFREKASESQNTSRMLLNAAEEAAKIFCYSSQVFCRTTNK